MIDTAIYIHIPFCDHKCIYCDFYSIISYENVATYLKALKNEITFYSGQYSSGRKIISIYFGGGTPSFMEPQYISEIIEHVKKNFFVSNDAEITLETNPGTVVKKKLVELKKIGINRMSVGIQSFNEDELKFLTRIHDAKTAVQTIHDAVESGFENISIDLIFNLPKQTKEKWYNNLNTAVNLPVKNISAYSLILEPGTILNKMVLDGRVTMQDDDYDAELYEHTISFLAHHGYEQYEVSNFSKSGYECIHNNAYWRYKEYFGFGTSAHSFINKKRWWNYSNLKFYNAAIEKKGIAVVGEEVLSEIEMLNEYVMLALRSKGLDLLEMQNLFGNEWFNRNKIILDQLWQENYISPKKDRICLTLKGYAICDEIIKNFI